MSLVYVLILCFLVHHAAVWCITNKDDGGIKTPIKSENRTDESEKKRPKVSDKYCMDKFSCVPNHKCDCHNDTICQSFQDCCQGFKNETHSKDSPNKYKYSCKKIPFTNNFGAAVVSACPDNWTNNESRALCEAYRRRIDVSESYMTDDRIVFFNIFCAFCNNKLPKMYNLHKLKTCANTLKKGTVEHNESCTFLYDRAAKKEALRKCPLPVVISNCLQDASTNELSYNCSHGDYGIVYDGVGSLYRNIYCALCRNKSLEELSCENDKVDVREPYSYAELVKDTKKNENEDNTMIYLTAILLTISIVTLLITLVIYCRFPKLMNVGGKITFCLALSLLIAQSLFLISAETEPITWLCKAMGISVHYFYLVTFCWMNILAFDLFKTFSNYHLDWENKRFLYYSLYAWLFPLLIVIISFIFNFVETVGSFNPKYGDTKCWFNSEDAKLAFFLIPLAVFKVFDMFTFLFTAYHISKARREAAFAKKGDTCSFLIYIKLSLIMGLTWTFAFLARYTDSDVLSYMFTIFNACQGLSLFLCFVLTNTVFKLVKNSYRFSFMTSSKTTKTTQC